MTKDEALAFDLALEALEYFSDTSPTMAGKAHAEDAITAIKQARSAPYVATSLVQEPVGWWDAKIGFFEEKHFDQLQPLYASPPAAQRPWVGLTDEQIDDIWNRYCDEMGEASINDAYDIARAIEAAHGITGEKT